ncbi:MAG: rbn [Solimicrobium sp.]|jgi:membrane protein|nr:rbn [Solimicrobium sp.]
MSTSELERLKSAVKHKQSTIGSRAKVRRLLSFSMRRIADGNLDQVAGSLTFTTILALVPMLTIALAIFTAFPLFKTFRESLEAYFIQNLMPHAISGNILSYLSEFAAKATQLSAFSAVALIITSIVTLATIDQIFNQIWHVKNKRSLLKRTLVYWAIITLAPLLLGVSLTVTSYIFIASEDVLKTIPGSTIFYPLSSIIFTSCAFTFLYITVPNRLIDWRDAAWGGLVAGILFEIAKHLFATFVTTIPTYTIVYGAVAIVPIFLVWIYTSWLIVLLGAIIAAALPVIKFERWWHVPEPGGRFLDAMTLLELLFEARSKTSYAGVSSWEIRKKAKLGFDEIENLLSKMEQVGWVGRLSKEEIERTKPPSLTGSECWVLLANPAYVSIYQVFQLFLFKPQLEDQLSQKVEASVQKCLQESLEEYFTQNTKGRSAN